MINILYIIFNSKIGGGPEHLYNLLKFADRAKYRFYVIAPNDGIYFNKFSDYSTVIEMDLRHHYLFNMFRISKVIKDKHISICHAHGRGAGMYGRPIKIFCKNVKSIYTYHGIHYFEERFVINDIIFLFIEKIFKYFTDANIAVSRKEYEESIRIGLGEKNKSYIVYNGVDLTKFNQYPRGKEYLLNDGININENTIVLGCVARFDPEKGYVELIKAVKKVEKIYHNIILLIIGDGPERKKIENEIQNQKIEDKIFLLGFRQDIPQLLKCIDIYVSASYKEGLPYALIEALASETLVVATKTTGNDEIIYDGETGILCNVKNVESLSNAIIKMIQEPENHASYRAKGLKLVKNKFAIETMVNNTFDIYRKIM